MPTPRKGKFTQTGTYLKDAIRRVSETRGFAETRLLTHWVDIVGPEFAPRVQPVKVAFPKAGFGAVLTVLCKGADAPMIEMSIPRMIERVNSAYGYRAISQIRVTQTAPSGFQEEQRPFEVQTRNQRKVDSKTEAAIDNLNDDGLRDALAALSQNLSGSDQKG
ncbi:MAG: DciA family protein [Pseudomonadota bacterium]